ncbi:LTA synthase family protein [Bacillus tianshenii]|nr:LTA synthase family protein [Bacillus tianshenii]
MNDTFKRLLEGLKVDRTLLFTVLLLWVKSYLVMRFLFDLPLDNNKQEFILFISPLSSTIILALITMTLFKRKKVLGLMIMYVVATLLLFANVVYYRFFEDFITIPVLYQFKNFGDLGGSAKGLMQPYDILLFIDIAVYYVVIKKILKPAEKTRGRVLFATVAAVLAFVNINLANDERPELLTRTFDREMLVKFLGVYNYHMYDLVVHSKASAQRTFAESDDLTEVENYVQRDVNQPGELFGAAKGKNLIILQVESLQSFAIDYKLHGEEVTPFLNSLKKNSFYFPNFYHQTGQGKTSDFEFLLDNSLYPLSRGAVFTTNAQNEYNSMTEMLKEKGYETAALHGNNKSFWNRDIMYKTLGYDHFFSERNYEVTPENSVNYGLKDKPFFEQSIPMLKSMQQPFYAKFITLTHHYPFTLSEEDQTIEPATTGDGTVDRYFQTARYLDESIQEMFTHLKEQGLYENSVIMVVGDHYGISQNHNRAMKEIMGTEINPYQHTKLQRVPMFIHIPGMDGKVMDTVSGQIDMKPTLLHLLGVETKGDIQFGSDLFEKDRDELVVLRDGSFITDKYLYAGDTCYDANTGEQIDSSMCEPIQEKAQHELELSDKVIEGDLLRFLDRGKEGEGAEKENKQIQ